MDNPPQRMSLNRNGEQVTSPAGGSLQGRSLEGTALGYCCQTSQVRLCTEEEDPTRDASFSMQGNSSFPSTATYNHVGPMTSAQTPSSSSSSQTASKAQPGFSGGLFSPESFKEATRQLGIDLEPTYDVVSAANNSSLTNASYEDRTPDESLEGAVGGTSISRAASEDAISNSSAELLEITSSRKDLKDSLGNPFYYHALRFLLVGDSDVGKNEILEKCDSHKLPLVNQKEVEFKTTMILLDGKRVKLQLWDTSGQGRFSTIIQSYSRGADGILLVFDITNKWSFESINKWMQEVEEYAPGVPKVLVGNRLHLEFKREVNKMQAMYFAAKHNMAYFEVSSLCDYNITETFLDLSRQVLNRIRLHTWAKNRVLSLQELCCRTIVQRTTSYSIERLPLPASVKSNLKSYSLNPYATNSHNCCAHKQHKCCLNHHNKKSASALARRSSSPHNLLESIPNLRHDKKCTLS